MSDLRDEDAELARTSLKKATESDKLPQRNRLERRVPRNRRLPRRRRRRPRPRRQRRRPRLERRRQLRTREEGRGRRGIGSCGIDGSAAAPTAEAKTASPIIRRRVKADGETETLTPAALIRPGKHRNTEKSTLTGKKISKATSKPKRTKRLPPKRRTEYQVHTSASHPEEIQEQGREHQAPAATTEARLPACRPSQPLPTASTQAPTQRPP